MKNRKLFFYTLLSIVFLCNLFSMRSRRRRKSKKNSGASVSRGSNFRNSRLSEARLCAVDRPVQPYSRPNSFSEDFVKQKIDKFVTDHYKIKERFYNPPGGTPLFYLNELFFGSLDLLISEHKNHIADFRRILKGYLEDGGKAKDIFIYECVRDKKNVFHYLIQEKRNFLLKVLLHPDIVNYSCISPVFLACTDNITGRSPFELKGEIEDVDLASILENLYSQYF